MSRATPKWKGKTPDTAIPPRVRLRVFERFNGICQLTQRKITPADKWEVDHIQPLILGGANEEDNLQPVLASAHKTKTRQDVAQKSKEARKRAKHLGVKKPTRKIPYRTADGRCHWNGKE